MIRLLALDTGSPIASVAVVVDEQVLALRTLDRLRTSEGLLPAIEEALAEAGLALRELDGLVGLSGPGSFTGLRIGLATLLGFHQALRVPATAVSTLATLAFAGLVDDLASPPSTEDEAIHAAVDALRGELFVQSFSPSEPTVALGEPRRLTPAGLTALAPGRLVGCGLAAPPGVGWPPHLRAGEAAPLAPAAARLAMALAGPPAGGWRAAALSEPIYLAAPVAGGSA